MEYYKKSFLRSLTEKQKLKKSFSTAIIDESINLNESIKFRKHSGLIPYDIFLSHSFDDKDIIFGLYSDLTYNFGFKVYIDWIVDPSLNRGNVTRENAKVLRNRMKQSKSLIYVVSNSAQDSKWMQWETGFFDGLKGKIAILPILGDYDITFDEQEYLKLYPIIDRGSATIWINRLEGFPSFKNLKEWIS